MSPDTTLRCLILGGGGHAHVLIDCLQASGIAIPHAVLDPDPALWGKEVSGVPVLGGDELLPQLVRQGITHFMIGLGAVGDNRPRRRLFELAVAHGMTPLTVCHPSAISSPWAKVGVGSLLAPAAIVNAGAVVGDNVIVNTAAVVEHGCVIGDHAHVATGAKLASTVTVGACTHIGAGATVRQGLSIGEGAIVGAGAVVVKDVAPWTVVVGVPARPMRQREPAQPLGDRIIQRAPKILVLGKEDDELCARAMAYVTLQASDVEVHRGRRGEAFPQIQGQSFDYLISYLCPWVVPAQWLQQVRVAAINFHPGPPEYPGIGCTNFALYEGAASYGVTCHHMELTVDTGPIIRIIRFPLYQTDTVLSLTRRCYAAINWLFYEIFDLILAGQPLPQSAEHWTRKPFRRADLDALCHLAPEMDDEEIRRRIRATTFPGYPGASFEPMMSAGVEPSETFRGE